MFVVVYTVRDNEVVLKRELRPNDSLAPREYANEVADMYDCSIDDSPGKVITGDIRVDIKENPESEVVVWASEAFYFKAE